MPIVKHAECQTYNLPGLTHRTVGGHEQGLKTMEVWVQSIAPGEATPVHRHDCEEVIVILSGAGDYIVEGVSHPFSADTTLVVEPDIVHQIINTSDEEMKLVAAFGTASVRVKTAEGEPLPLPWEAP